MRMFAGHAAEGDRGGNWNFTGALLGELGIPLEMLQRAAPAPDEPRLYQLPARYSAGAAAMRKASAPSFLVTGFTPAVGKETPAQRLPRIRVYQRWIATYGGDEYADGPSRMSSPS